ncbi:MAG: hypothetical protein IJ848_01910 [Alphaproteobacteria bacterium]|nr:hypothetical protein [Alphaproteobacteria bacterium]
MNKCLKIIITMCSICFINNIYGNENDLCCLKQFQSDSESLQENINNFFGNNIHYIDRMLNCSRCNNQTELEQILTLSSNHDYGIDNENNISVSKVIVPSNKVLFLGNQSVLSMEFGSIISMQQNSKILITGNMKIEPGCIINVGDKNDIDEKIFGEYLIINSNVVNLHNITINLNGANSHLEIHGNDISLSNCKINVFHPKATVHIHNELLNNFVPINIKM